MPRSAATIVGLVLVASSIGFNAHRYPVVWEMVGPARAEQSTQPSAASQSEKPESPTAQPPVPPPAEPAKPIDMKPDAAGTGAGQDGLSAKAGLAGGDDGAAAEPNLRRPLVPVTPVSMVGGPADPAVIRRLPPVEQSGTNPVSAQGGQLPGGSIPVYPTTGIE